MQDAVESEFAVDPAELERHVRRSWRPIQEGDEQAFARTTTMNLIAVARSEDEMLLRSSLSAVFRASPCLAFLVFLDQEHRTLRAHFSRYAKGNGQNRRVVLECISLFAGPAEERRVASLVRPLLLDDLPTQFFWAAPLPANAGLFFALGASADQVVVDSSLFDRPESERRRLTEMRVESLDLAWMRLVAWRRALAEAFEHFQWRPGEAVTAEIRHGDTAGTRAASRALAAWLHARLNAEVQVVAAPHGQAPVDEPCSVVLRVGQRSVCIEHGWPAPRLRVTVELEATRSIPYEIVSPPRSRGELLVLAAREIGVLSATAR
jgi:hypothetical protein